MDNTVVQVILTVLSLLGAVWAFLRWQKKKSIWLLTAVIVLALAAAASWLAIVNGVFLAILGAALLFLGLLFKKGKQ
jgi:asparagine N-glycosylation enzyme membrane subunit Stt3